MEIINKNKICKNCKHSGHSGAFTPGGAISVCCHRNAPRGEVNGVNDFRDITTKEIAEKVFNQRKIDFKNIPEWCPLINGFPYID